MSTQRANTRRANTRRANTRLQACCRVVQRLKDEGLIPDRANQGVQCGKPNTHTCSCFVVNTCECLVCMYTVACQCDDCKFTRKCATKRSHRECTLCHTVACISQPKFKTCGRCKSVFYCSAECQKKHWPAHRHMCK
jgi:hypothetical protein